jgi:transposase
MARYKRYDYTQMAMVAVDFQRQILPGTFEHTLSRLIDEKFSLEVFEERYDNDDNGAPAYDPAILLKIILFAYSRGITSSREISDFCVHNVVCLALAAHSCPHFTTIAKFVATLGGEISALFRDVLLVCDEMGLIGKQMFAVDGVKLPSNAAKEWSGTKAEFQAKAAKMQEAVDKLVERHRVADERGDAPEVRAAREQKIDTLERAVNKVRAFLDTHEDKIGAEGQAKKSNITDNDSAKMKTSKGVIQGYDGVALVDDKHQVVVAAEAFGEGQEHALLQPVLEGARENFEALGQEAVLSQAKLAADAGFHSEDNLKYLAERGIDAYVADSQFRSRDERFEGAQAHKPAPETKAGGQASADKTKFGPQDFQVDENFETCICPAGKRLYRTGTNCKIGGYRAVKFHGAQRDCLSCPLRERCLKHPERTAARQVAFFLERMGKAPKKNVHCARMREKIDSEQGRYAYSRRLGIVEPVFANICSTHGLDYFRLRGKAKVNTVWLLYCMVHNIGKVQRYGKWKANASR